MNDPLVIAELALCGQLDESEFKTLREWALSFMTLSSDIPPLGVLLSIGRCLIGASFVGNSVEPSVQKFEEWVLHRIACDPLISIFREKLNRADHKRKSTQVAVLVDILLDRIGYQRAMSFLGLRETLAQGQGLHTDLSQTEAVLEQYELIAELGKRCRSFLCRDDLLVLDFPDTFRKKSQRIAFRVLSERVSRLEDEFPKRVRRKSDGNSATKQRDDSVFPSGGYSTITNSGDVESVLSSELAYMTDSDELDLFSIRWASGELLKYTRDDGVALRAKRVIHVFAGSDYLAEMIAGVRKLVCWLSSVDLSVRIHYDGDSGFAKQLLSTTSGVEFVRELPDAEAESVYLGIEPPATGRVFSGTDAKSLFVKVAEL